MAALLGALAVQLPTLNLDQHAALAGGLASVGYKPAPAWMAAFVGALCAARPSAPEDAAALLAVLASLRRMQYVPGPAAAAQLDALVAGIAPMVPGSTMAQLRSALDDLQYMPRVAAAAGGAVRVARGGGGAPRAAAPLSTPLNAADSRPATATAAVEPGSAAPAAEGLLLPVAGAAPAAAAMQDAATAPAPSSPPSS